jgi:hypothetical protein
MTTETLSESGICDCYISPVFFVSGWLKMRGGAVEKIDEWPCSRAIAMSVVPKTLLI